MVDLFHLPYGAMLPAQGIDLLESDKYPNVTRCAFWAGMCASAILTSFMSLGGGRRSHPVPPG